MLNIYEAAADIYDERKARRKHSAALRRARLESAPRPVNGTGATAGKSPRDYLMDRMSQDARRLEAGKFASAALEIRRLIRRGQ